MRRAVLSRLWAAFGWAPAVEEYLAPRLPWVKFILPTAPSIAVTLNFGAVGPAWVCYPLRLLAFSSWNV
jgi:hypothetical protein